MHRVLLGEGRRGGREGRGGRGEGGRERRGKGGREGRGGRGEEREGREGGEGEERKGREGGRERRGKGGEGEEIKHKTLTLSSLEAYVGFGRSRQLYEKVGHVVQIDGGQRGSGWGFEDCLYHWKIYLSHALTIAPAMHNKGVTRMLLIVR